VGGDGENRDAVKARRARDRRLRTKGFRLPVFFVGYEGAAARTPTAWAF
jgi:hypothetical protein